MARAHSHEMWLHDQASRMGKALRKVRKEQKLEDARKMKAEGLEIDLISRITELSAEEIEKL